MDILQITDIYKSFGSKKILDGVSFNVSENSIFGFIGKNGAGKTTTMKMILGLLKPDSGNILVNGEKVTFGQNKTNKYIGYLPDVPEFYGYMTPREYLMLCGQIVGLDNSVCKDRANELLSLVGLTEHNKKIRGFSRGMKQRLGIAQALLAKPKLLICDEPTSALDPLGRKEILDILTSVKKDTTVLFSTHILSDVEKICDNIAFLNQGKITITGTIDEIKRNRCSEGFEIEVSNENEADSIAKRFDGSKRKTRNTLLYENKPDELLMELMKYLTDQGIVPLKIEKLEPTLEDLFIETVGGEELR